MPIILSLFKPLDDPESHEIKENNRGCLAVVVIKSNPLDTHVSLRICDCFFYLFFNCDSDNKLRMDTLIIDVLAMSAICVVVILIVRSIANH